MGKREEDNYFYTIAYEFLSRTKRSYFLTPLEIDLIQKWQKEEIPLSIVLRGLKEGFKKSGRKKTLLFFKGFVQKEYKNYLRAIRGKGKGEKEEKKEDDYGEFLDMIEFIKDERVKKLYMDFFSRKRNFQEKQEFDELIDSEIYRLFEGESEKYKEEWEKKFSFIKVDEKTKESLIKKYLIVKKREELNLFSVSV